MTLRRSPEEEEIYQNQLKIYERQIVSIKKEMDLIEKNEEDELEAFTAVIEILKNAGTYYATRQYVRKRKIIELFFSNIIVDNKKRLSFVPRP